MQQHTPILILGAGLAGLTLAWRLKQHNIDATILEARDRIGGRIHTLYPEGQAPQEMGATWLGRKHTALVRLLQELGLSTFQQELSDRAIYEPISTSPPQLVQLPPNNDPSYRIAGGTAQLIQRAGQPAGYRTN
jgi:protoporphyrinogen oxidase